MRQHRSFTDNPRLHMSVKYCTHGIFLQLDGRLDLRALSFATQDVALLATRSLLGHFARKVTPGILVMIMTQNLPCSTMANWT